MRRYSFVSRAFLPLTNVTTRCRCVCSRRRRRCQPRADFGKDVSLDSVNLPPRLARADVTLCLTTFYWLCDSPRNFPTRVRSSATSATIRGKSETRKATVIFAISPLSLWWRLSRIPVAIYLRILAQCHGHSFLGARNYHHDWWTRLYA